MKENLTFATLLTAFFVCPLNAQESWAWAGLGMASCDNIVADKSNPMLKAAYGQWVWGFWTGINSERMLNNESYRSLSIFRDELQVADAVISACSQEPSDQKIAVVAMTLYERLGLAALN